MNIKQMLIEESKKFGGVGHTISYLESASAKDLYETLGQDIIDYVDFNKKMLIAHLRGTKTIVKKNAYSPSDKEVLDSYLFVLTKHADDLIKYISSNTLLK